MSEETTEAEQAGRTIVEWAKQSVDLISIEPFDDMWRARLAIAGRFGLVVTFWRDNYHPLEENRLHIEEVQEVQHAKEDH